MKSLAKIDIPVTPMVYVRTLGNTDAGAHASTMELFQRDDPTSLMIEWDVPTLDRTEHIGLIFERMTNGDLVLTDYDGVYSLPKEAIEFLRAQKYIVPDEFVTYIVDRESANHSSDL